ncbi:MAG: DUF6782 family putative metallopeptidase [Roseovarius sp.]|nr:DUF6782 family putative metallopeptidase [Roseovarius sp.]
MFAARFFLLASAFILLMLPPVGARAAPICADYPYASAPRIAALMAPLRPVLARLPSMRAALDFRQPEICLRLNLLDAHGYLDAQGTRLVLSAQINPALQRLILLHELRHLDQVVHGVCPPPDLSMQSNARAVMAMEADASAISLLAAWTLREWGDPSVWNAASDWPSQSDIADAFARNMEETRDPAAATAAAFARWFASDWRRESYYLAACDDYLTVQDRTKRLPRYRALSADFLETLCRMPGGQAYACALPDTSR